MSREVRMVPPGWQHPKGYVPWSREPGHLPLRRGPYSKVAADWDAGEAKWAKGLCKDYKGGWRPVDDSFAGLPYQEWEGERPRREEYMPEFDPGTATHLMMYETVSEGTPISPACESPEALARWLADNPTQYDRASYETWLAMINGGGWAPSAWGTVKDGFVTGVEMFNPSRR